MPEAVGLVGLYAGILGLLGLVLAIRVVATRARKEIGLGDRGDPAMLAVIRTFGNFAEYVPLALVLILIAALSGVALWAVHALAGGLLLGRILHSVGVKPDTPVTLGRIAGASITWLVIAAAALLLIYLAVAGGGRNG